MSYAQIHEQVTKLSTPERAKSSSWFFKTGTGEYGEGDLFAGLTVPQSRSIAQKNLDISYSDCDDLLQSKLHEERLIALLILVEKYKVGTEKDREDIFKFYLSHLNRINNWDLVDTSADKIVGEWLYTHPDKKLIHSLVLSSVLWDRRVAVLASYAFIKHGNPDLTFEIATTLLSEREDLLHKAVGWMLREVGKRCGREILVPYLRMHYKKMPRTMLRYAIEHFSADERKKYLQGLV